MIRPPPLETAMMPTRPPPSRRGVTADVGGVAAAWEIRAIPAATLRARMLMSRYHCGVRSASSSVESLPRSTTGPLVAAEKPGTWYPLGGLGKNHAPTSVRMRYPLPKGRDALVGRSSLLSMNHCAIGEASTEP
jgi:hypothetical protein